MQVVASYQVGAVTAGKAMLMLALFYIQSTLAPIKAPVYFIRSAYFPTTSRTNQLLSGLRQKLILKPGALVGM